MDYNRIDAILEDYRARGYYPDAVCHVFNEKDKQYFDLASVSKIICTTMILTLVDEGKLTFNTKICELLPNLGEVSRERLKAVTVRMLMTHTSGIVPWYPFYADGRDFYVVLEHVLSTTPKEVGMAYSDLNFMLLGVIFQQVTGLTLREGLERYFREKLGIRDSAKHSSNTSRSRWAFPKCSTVRWSLRSACPLATATRLKKECAPSGRLRSTAGATRACPSAANATTATRIITGTVQAVTPAYSPRRVRCKSSANSI